MKNWFDLAAKRHSLIKEAIIGAIGGALARGGLSAAKRVGGMMARNPGRTLEVGLTGMAGAGAAAAAAGSVSKSREGAQAVKNYMDSGRTF